MEQSRLNEVLEKHKKWLDDEEEGERANLQDADLRYANLRGVNLRGVNLRYADLRYTDLRGANLWYADLQDSDLQDADLRDANLRYADLRDSDLQDADLQDADLQGANLDYSCLPLWCGGLRMHIDDKIAIQILYHLLSLVSYSKHVSPHIKELLLTNNIVELANKFHRVDECEKLNVYEER